MTASPSRLKRERGADAARRRGRRRRRWSGSAGCPGRWSRCRARRCPTRPGSRAPGRPRRCRGWQPTSWPITSGRSGLPKLRLSVMRERPAADGGDVAPGLGHRLLAALDRIGLAIARRHVGGQREALRAVLDRARSAASPPGVCTVLPRMRWSYCSQTQRFEHRSGEPTSLSSASRVRDRRRDRLAARSPAGRCWRCAGGRRAAPRRRAP